MTVDTKQLAKRVNELLVLTTLHERPKHGYQIALDVERATGGTFELQHGTLYPILHRLEDEGLVEGRWSEEGRRRKEYRLTRAGRRRLGEDASRVRKAFGSLLEFLDASEGREDGALRTSPAAG